MSEGNKNENKLNDLLDDALKDFEDSESSDAKTTNNNNNTSDDQQNEEENFEEYLSKQTQLLNDCMSSYINRLKQEYDLNSSDQMLDNLKKMGEAASIVLQGKSNANDDDVAKYSKIVGQAFKAMQGGSNNVDESAETEDLSFFNIGNIEANDDNEFLPLMEGTMQGILSSDIILPSIKGLVDSYPKYLADNDDKLSTEEKYRYNKQYELYKNIADHIKNADANNTPKARRENFKIILGYIRKLQLYGEIPKEMYAKISETASSLDSGAVGGDSIFPIPYDFFMKFLNNFRFF